MIAPRQQASREGRIVVGQALQQRVGVLAHGLHAQFQRIHHLIDEV